jgi:DNA (cytosine-5)-methyltransferase 1
MPGLLIDNFAGGGGASYALMEAFGRKVDFAINHNAEALAMHEANHPETHHILSDVFEVDPFEVCAGRPIDAAWFSPDCTHFSRAKGGKPRSKKIRALAWVVLKWASLPAWQRPRVIFLENVEEFETWGPLDDEGYPIKEREGETYAFWRKSLEKRGYVLEARKLRACDYGAPTIRKRLFMVARCDGEPIRWPEVTHRDPRKPRPPQVRVKLKPWRTAAECIDWSIPCPSIFERKKDLAENTLRRIARGVMRYVVENPTPFIVRVTQSSNTAPVDAGQPLPTITTARGGEMALVSPHITKFMTGQIGHAIDTPLHTVTANSFQKRPGGGPTMGLVSATMIQTGYGERPGQSPRTLDLDRPIGTLVDGGKHAVVAAFLSQFSGTTDSKINVGHHPDKPMSTIVGRGPLQAVTAAHLLSLKGSDRRDQAIDGPAPAITAGGGHAAAVTAFLLSYYGNSEEAQTPGGPLHTVTTRDRFGLVVVLIKGEPYFIADIGMRMLTPRELFTAQGFSPSYKIDLTVNGRKMPKATQIRLVGNSVSPPPAIALAVANAPLMSRMRLSPEREALTA